ncbi:MAG: sigma-70 family RNA polymerase sigma factor [Firmicutes bacterium]|nr:sigma-70 family RNA polymerase sigma factor [Bacillota bacterium]
MHLRFMKKVRSEVSLYDPIGTDKEGNEISLIDVLGTHPEIVAETVENNFEHRRILNKLTQLTQREKKILELRFGLGEGGRRTQREIARRLGISRSYVSRIEKKALSKLIRELNLEGCH